MMSEKRFTHINVLGNPTIRDKKNDKSYIQYDEETTDEICDLLNKLSKENEQLKNELRKEKSLLEYSDSMYGADLIVNIRFTNGEWKADVSVIDNE